MPDLHPFIKFAWIAFPVGMFLSMIGQKIPDCNYLVYLGSLLVLSAIFSIGGFLFLVLRCALRGERALIFDAIDHVIRDPETNEIMFFNDIDGTIRDYQTGEFLCKFDFDKNKFFDKNNNIISFDELDKEWLAKKNNKL
ncbi:MAG: hypothetical protein LBP59_02790 [Planctomycetaceae bacterium]|jgi:hypothetical protein|nr:hypothetical protein [Planctomycetaceae bacterium]